MAKVIKKSDRLEKNYLKRKRPVSRALNIFKMFVLLFIMGFVIAFMLFRFGLIKNEKIAFLVGAIITVTLETAGLRYLVQSEDRKGEILQAGLEGESDAAKILSKLPDSFTVFQNVDVTYDGKSSEIDSIAVGETGVFIIETKNHKGYITGSVEDKEWHQYKTGRKGGSYSKKLYNPVKQVGTHVYRVAHYLRENGVKVHVTGAVYFTNEECTLDIGKIKDIPVLSKKKHGEKGLLDFIKGGEKILTKDEVRKITDILKSI